MSERFAKIPLKIALRLHSVSAAAAGLYTVLRAYNNELTGQCNPSAAELRSMMEAHGFPMPKQTFYDARNELMGQKKVRDKQGNIVRYSEKLIDFDGENYHFLDPAESENPDSESPEIRTQKSEKPDSKSPKIRTASPKIRTQESENPDCESENPDSLLHVTDKEQTTEQTKNRVVATTTTSAVAEQRAYQKTAARTGTERRGGYRFQEYLDYVEARSPEKTPAQQAGLARYLEQSGADDEAVAAFQRLTLVRQQNGSAVQDWVEPKLKLLREVRARCKADSPKIPPLEAAIAYLAHGQATVEGFQEYQVTLGTLGVNT